MKNKSFPATRWFASFTSFVALLALALGAANFAQAASSSWNVNAAGNWTTSADWAGSVVPGSTSADNADVATFSFTLTAARTVTVDTTRYIGGISFGNTSAFGYTLATGTLRLNSGGVIQSLSTDGAHTETISGPLQLDGTSGATATFTSGSATAADGVLSIGGLTGSAATGYASTLTLNGVNTGANTVTGIIGDGGGGGKLAIVKDGTGQWTLSGVNTFTGGLTVQNGTLFGTVSTSCFGATAGTITLGNGSTLSTGAAIQTGQILPQAMTVGSGGSGTLTFGNNANGAGGISGAITLNNNLTIQNNGTSSTGATTLSGNISGTGNLTLNNDSGSSGVLTLSGTTVNNAGTIVNSGTAGTGGTTISAAVGSSVTGITQNSATSPMTISGTVTATGPINVSAGNLILGGGAGTLPNITGITVSSGDAVSPQDGATYSSVPITISGVGTSLYSALDFRPGGGGTVTWPGAITLGTGGATIRNYGANATKDNLTGGIKGTGPLTLTASGNSSTANTTTISGTACTYSGSTTISIPNSVTSYTLKLGIANALPTGTVLNFVNSGSSTIGTLYLDLDGYSHQLGGLSWDAVNTSTYYNVINSSATASMLTINSSAPYTFGGVIGTSGKAGINLVVQGNTTTLSGVNGYTGNTTINSSGTLTLSGSGAIDSSPTVSVASGCTLNVLSAGFNRTSGQTLTGAGTVSGGTVTIGSSGALAPGDSGVGTITLGALTMNSGSVGNFEFSTTPANDLVNVTGGGGLTINSGATVNLYQVGTITPFTTGGTYNLFQYSGTLNGTAISGSVVNLTVANAQVGYTYGFAATGSYVTVTITPPPWSDWNLTGGGSWATGADWTPATVPNAAGYVAEFGVLASPVITGSATVTLDGNQTVGTLNFSNSTGTASFTINPGTPGSSALTLSSSLGAPLVNDFAGSHTVAVPLTLPSLPAGANVNVASASSLALNGAVSGGGLTNIGSGTLTLAAANSYNGTTVSAGTVDVTGPGTLGNTGGALNVNGGTLDLGVTTQTVGSVTIAGGTLQNGTITGTSFAGQSGTVNAVLDGSSAVLTKSTTGILTLTNANTYTGGTVVNGGILSVSADDNFGAVPGSAAPGNIVLNGGSISNSTGYTLNANRGIAVGPASGSGSGTIDTAANQTLTYAGIIANNSSGTGALIVNPNGNGSNVLSGANTYTGGTWLTNGTLEIAATQVGQGGFNIGTLDAAPCTLNIDAVATVVVGAASTFQVGNNVASGVATATPTVNVAGAVTNNGTLLAGRCSVVNLNSGASWTQSGNLTVQAYGNLSAALTVNPGATFIYTGANPILVNGPGASYGPTATLTIKGTFVTDAGFQQTATYTTGSGSGQIIINGGTLRLSATPAMALFATPTWTNFAATVIGAATIDTGIYNANVTNVISGSGSLTKLGTGTLTLTAANTYTGNTTNSAGTLALGLGGSLSASSSVSLAAGAIFDVSALASYTLGSSASLTASGNSTGAATIKGGSSATVSLGSRPVTLTYDGSDPALTVSQGTLALSGNTFTVVTGSALAPGVYTLMSTPNSISGTVNATPSFIGGSGLASGATGAVSISGDNVILTVTGITLSGTLAAANSTYGLYSPTPASFTVSAGGLSPASGSLTVTPPGGYVVSTTSGSGYTTSLSLPYSGGALGSTTVYVALANTDPVSGGPYSGNISISGGGATTATIATVASSVSPATPTVTVNVGSYTYTGLPQGPGSIATISPVDTGSVSWSYAGTDNSGGTYASSIPPTLAGSYTATATVAADSNNNSASSSATAFTIGQASTFVGAFSSENPSGYQDSISFTATLPTDANGNVVFSSTNGPISTNGFSRGSATSLSISNLPRGTNVITVAYLGDFNYFGSTNSALLQVVTNHPPVASVMTVTRTAGLNLVIALSAVATNWSDVDGDTVELTGVNMQSTNGVNLGALNWTTNVDGSLATTNAAAFIGYTNSPNVADQISYSLSDGHGGTNVGFINIVINSSVTGSNSITAFSYGSSANIITAYGVIGYSYILERATNLAPAVWVDLQTNQAASNGVINASDTFWDLGGVQPPAAYYQLKWQP